MSDVDNTSAQLEAILFVADRPLSVTALATAVALPIDQVTAALGELGDALDQAQRGIELREVGGGFRLYVRNGYEAGVNALTQEVGPSKLSQAALETLAVVAYKQPVTRRQIASIRAVNVDSVVRNLVTRGYIDEAYADDETGAIYYQTTDLVLAQLGINSLDELPPISPLLPDIDEADEILGESYGR